LKKFLQDAGVKLEDTSNIEDVVLQVIEDQGKEVTTLTEQVATLTGKVTEMTTQLEDKEPDAETTIELSELNDKVVKLSADFVAEQAKSVALEVQLFDKDRDVFLSSMVSQGKMLPAEMDNFKLLYKADQATTVSVLEARSPVVNLEELGGEGNTTLEYEDRLHNEAIKLQDADSDLGYMDAVLKAESRIGKEK